MSKYFKIGIVIIVLMCMMVQVVGAYDGEVEASVCIIWGIGAGIIGAIVFTIIEVQKHKPVSKASNADYYIKDGDAKMSVSEDKYLRSTEVKTKVANSDSNAKK